MIQTDSLEYYDFNNLKANKEKTSGETTWFLQKKLLLLLTVYKCNRVFSWKCMKYNISQSC